jgi:Na+/H+ antiporter NhaD/arsenite permease-like protein
VLIIGNPTNIIVAEAFNLQFVEYTSWVAIPAITSGVACLGAVWLLLRKKIPDQIQLPDMSSSSQVQVDVKGSVSLKYLVVAYLTRSTEYAV